ncbi:helix-turn-helix domain-containing protein [Halogeometricum borinquense]|nr:helix-turn-helix domain-containing protein [Halogeometricum borinquense]
MKSIRARLTLPDSLIHPMHAFVAETPGFRRTSLLHGNPLVDDRNTFLFHVDGDDPETYTDALEASPSILDYEITQTDDRPGFYLAVQEGDFEADAGLSNAFLGTGVVVVSPIIFREDRSVDLSLVGTAEALTDAFESLPPSIEADVREIHEYDGRVADPAAALSPRQRDALVVAVELGYYGNPREASVSAVADRLDCSTGTAAEHLRKAEAAVFRRIVRDGPARW